MRLEDFKKSVIDRAKAEGFNESELYYEISTTTSIDVYKGDIDNYQVSDVMGISFRGKVDGNIGYSYTERIDEDSIDMLVKGAKDSAKLAKKEDNSIFEGNENYNSCELIDEKLLEMSTDEKIEQAKLLDKIGYETDSRVINAKTEVQTITSKVGLVNSKGLDKEYEKSMLYMIYGPVVKEGDWTNNVYEFNITAHSNDVNVEEMAQRAVNKALAYKGASSIESGKYKVLLTTEASIMLMMTFADIFSGDTANKGMSLLKDKEEGCVASECVTLIDNPLMDRGLASCEFDGEGVATYTKNIIESGVLKTLLYDRKSAKEAGKETTGNAIRTSYSAPITVAPSNIYFKQGEKSYDELLEMLEEGLVIENLAGLHSGANPITGDFSVLAKGFYIKDGKVERAVEQITISGNYYDVLKQVEAVGKDIKFFSMNGKSSYGSAELLIKELSVAGK